MADQAEWPLPPFVQIKGFFEAADHAALLDWVMSRQQDFQPATVGGKSDSARLDPAVRIGLVMRDLGPLRERIERRLAEALPELIEATGPKGPEPRSIELELAAHGDGAHYEAHLDIPVGSGRQSIGA